MAEHKQIFNYLGAQAFFDDNDKCSPIKLDVCGKTQWINRARALELADAINEHVKHDEPKGLPITDKQHFNITDCYRKITGERNRFGSHILCITMHDTGNSPNSISMWFTQDMINTLARKLDAWRTDTKGVLRISPVSGSPLSIDSPLYCPPTDYASKSELDNLRQQVVKLETRFMVSAENTKDIAQRAYNRAEQIMMDASSIMTTANNASQKASEAKRDAIHALEIACKIKSEAKNRGWHV